MEQTAQGQESHSQGSPIPIILSTASLAPTSVSGVSTVVSSMITVNGTMVAIPVPWNFGASVVPIPLNLTLVPQNTTPPLPLTVPTSTPPVSAAVHIPQASGTSYQPLEYLDLDEEPIYVNAKQYERIVKRRVARAKLVDAGLVKAQPQRLKYLHESRSKHAVNRLRGPLGRFKTRSRRANDGNREKNEANGDGDSKDNPTKKTQSPAKEEQTQNEMGRKFEQYLIKHQIE